MSMAFLPNRVALTNEPQVPTAFLHHRHHHAHQHRFIFYCTNGAFPKTSLVNDHLPSKSPKSTVDKLESLLYPDSCVAQEKIEAPAGVPSVGRTIHNKPKCSHCETKGLVLCATCSGSGLYIDSILESQGIIVKVRCLGCGGSGSILCSYCGGRGHT